MIRIYTYGRRAGIAFLSHLKDVVTACIGMGKDIVMEDLGWGICLGRALKWNLWIWESRQG